MRCKTLKQKEVTYLSAWFIHFHFPLSSSVKYSARWVLKNVQRDLVNWNSTLTLWEKNKCTIESFCFVFCCCCCCCCCCFLFLFWKAVNSISAYSEVTCCSNLDLFAKTSPVLINFRRSTYQVLALWPKLTVDWLVSLSRVIGCRVLEASRPADTDRWH